MTGNVTGEWEPDAAPVVRRGEGDGEAAVINYYFPVRVEVVGALPDTEVNRVAGYVFDQLDREMTTRI